MLIKCSSMYSSIRHMLPDIDGTRFQGCTMLSPERKTQLSSSQCFMVGPMLGETTRVAHAMRCGNSNEDLMHT